MVLDTGSKEHKKLRWELKIKSVTDSMDLEERTRENISSKYPKCPDEVLDIFFPIAINSVVGAENDLQTLPDIQANRTDS